MGHSIYLADDEKSIRELLHSFLASDGYTVRSFESGDALLEAFCQEPAELVILDIMMPGTDGLTVCRELRSVSDIPIILLTAKDSELDYVMGISQGSDDYLTKPFRPTILLMKVQALLRRVEMDRGKTAAEDELRKIYETGRGSVRVRSKWTYNKEDNCLEVTEIPYSTTIEAIVDKIVDCIKQGKLREVSYVRDETDIDGLKIAFDLKRGSDPQKVMHKLFRLTPLQDS